VHAIEPNDDGHDVPPAPTALRAAHGLADTFEIAAVADGVARLQQLPCCLR
jgi:hypothetical protein